MRKSIPVIATLGLALALAVPAAAQRTPGVEEVGAEERIVPMGLVLNPTAYTLPSGQWLFGAGTFQQTVARTNAARQFSLGAFRGLSDRWHAGGFWANVRQDLPGGGTDTDNFIGGAAQWQFANESRTLPALSLGGYIYGGDGTGGTAYAVASKNLASSVRPGAVIGHVGLRWDTFNGIGDDSDTALFVGANVLVTNRLSLNGEWREAHPWEQDGLWAAGASFLLENNWVVSAGLQDPGHGRTKFFAGLSVIP